jgi:molybdate transport repressor ModE-like protein
LDLPYSTQMALDAEPLPDGSFSPVTGSIRSTPPDESERRWRGVEVRHFATLAAVAETGSFRAAAARRGYVPSSVSQQISELERLVGDQLVERRRGQRQVALTPAGSHLAARGRSVLASFEAAQVDLEAVRSDGLEARVTIDKALVDALLGPIAQALGDLTESVLVIDECDDDAEPARQVEAGIADLGIGAFPIEGGELETVVLASDPYELLVRTTVAGSGNRPPLTRDRLAAMRLVIPAGSPSPCQTLSRLGSLGVPTSGAVVVHSADVAALVRAGFGVGVVARSMHWADEEGLARLPAHHLLGSRALAGMWHRRRRLGSDVVAQFLKAVPSIRRALGTSPSPDRALDAV